jgi:hypothetical protein
MKRVFPPDIETYFEEQRREQQSYVQTAMIQQTLNSVMETMVNNTLKSVSERGIALQMTEDASEALVQSSQEFLQHATIEPWWKKMCKCKFIPPWWCSFCRKEDENGGHSRTSASAAATAATTRRRRAGTTHV